MGGVQPDVLPQANMVSPNPGPLPQPGYQVEDAPAPRFGPSMQPGHSLLDRLALAIGDAGPMPNTGRGGAGQSFVGGLAQGFSRARMAKMLDDSLTQQTLREAQAKRNERAIAENEQRRAEMRSESKDITKRRRDLEAFYQQEMAKAKFREPPKTAADLRAEAAARTQGEFDAKRAAGIPLYTPPQPAGGPRIGPMDLTPQQITAMGSLSDNVRQDVKDFVTVRDNYERIRKMAENNSGVGDLSIIFAYMKVLDPTSVVRETEFNNAAAAVGKLQQVTTVPSFVLRGNRLTPEGRKWFVKSARDLYETNKIHYDQTRAFYEAQARAAGLDPSLIIRDYSASESTAPVPDGYEMVDGIRVRKAK